MKIYGVHPEDKNLQFLKRGIQKLSEENRENFQYLKLSPNHRSHESAANILSRAENGLVLFFCHSIDNTIRGCQIIHAAAGREHSDFSYGAWISPTKNMEIFAGKSVFCLACNSNDLSSYAMANNANVFLGFDDIPFYVREDFKVERITELVKNELEQVITKGLCQAIENNFSFNQLALYLRMLFSQRYFELMKDKEKGRTTKVEVAKTLLKIRSGIKVHGDGEIKLKA
jgi:hypothetical protein